MVLTAEEIQHFALPTESVYMKIRHDSARKEVN